MCGICGVYGLHVSNTEELRVFRDLVYVNTLRGEDSTGILKVKKDKSLHVTKSLLAGADYVKTDGGREFIFDPSTLAMLGHTRAATLGKVSLENAHPFEFEHVIGMHNGTVRKFFKHDREYETDSQAIYCGINESGIEATLKDIAGGTSAYALVWIDKDKKTLNFLRNKERPLHFSFIFDRTALAWSSDVEHLRAVLDFHSVSATGYDPKSKKGMDRFWTLKPHTMMSVSLGAPATTAKMVNIDVDPEPKPPSYTSSTKTTKVWTEQEESDWYDAHYGNSYKTYPSYDDWHENEFGFYEPRQNHRAVEVTKDLLERARKSVSHKVLKYDSNPPKAGELKYKLQQGCCICGQIIDPDDKDEMARIQWYNRDLYTCGDDANTAFWQDVITHGAQAI